MKKYIAIQGFDISGFGKGKLITKVLASNEYEAKKIAFERLSKKLEEMYNESLIKVVMDK